MSLTSTTHQHSQPKTISGSPNTSIRQPLTTYKMAPTYKIALIQLQPEVSPPPHLPSLTNAPPAPRGRIQLCPRRILSPRGRSSRRRPRRPPRIPPHRLVSLPPRLHLRLPPLLHLPPALPSPRAGTLHQHRPRHHPLPLRPTPQRQRRQKTPQHRPLALPVRHHPRLLHQKKPLAPRAPAPRRRRRGRTAHGL